MTAFVNNVKTVALLAALLVLFAMVGAAIDMSLLIPFLLIGIVMNFVAWFFSDTIAIRAMRGREIDESTGGDLYRMIQSLCQREGMPMPRVYLCPHEAPNAFATGRSPSKAAVAFTQGAINLLGPEELEGVAAHELAHIKNRDTLTSTIAATVAGTLASLAYWGFLFMGNRGGNPLVMFGVLILAAVGAAMLKSMISRSREFVADAEAARMVGSPNGLISALQRLDAYSQRIPMQQPNPAQNNLFIVEPLCGNSVSKLFASHPPIEVRVRALQNASV